MRKFPIEVAIGMNNYAYEILYPAPLVLLLFSLFFTCFLFSIFYQSLFFTAINCQSMQFSVFVSYFVYEFTVVVDVFFLLSAVFN